MTSYSLRIADSWSASDTPAKLAALKSDAVALGDEKDDGAATATGDATDTDDSDDMNGFAATAAGDEGTAAGTL